MGSFQYRKDFVLENEKLAVIAILVLRLNDFKANSMSPKNKELEY